VEKIVTEASQSGSMGITIIVFLWGAIYLLLRFLLRRMLADYDRRIDSIEEQTGKNTISIARLEEQTKAQKTS